MKMFTAEQIQSLNELEISYEANGKRVDLCCYFLFRIR